MSEKPITICPRWLEKLEVEINKELKERFPNKNFSVSKLTLQYNVKKPMDMFQGKRFVLTDPIVATCDLNPKDAFEKGIGEGAQQARILVGEKLSERLRTKGIWQ
jgi:hypothetical protein